MKLTANVPHALPPLRGAPGSRRGRDFISSFTGSPTVDTWAGLRVTDMPGNAVLALRGLVGFWTVDASDAWADDVVLALTRGLVGSRAVDMSEGLLLDDA